MRTLKECKDIMKAVKESLDSFAASFGDLSLSYDESYADFMLSSTNNDVYIRIKDKDDEENVYIVCDGDASKSRKEVISKLIKNHELLNNLVRCETEINESDTETEIKTFSINGKIGTDISLIVADLISEIWPYVLGNKSVDEEITVDDSIEEIIQEENVEEAMENNDETKDFEERSTDKNNNEKPEVEIAKEENTKEDIYDENLFEEDRQEVNASEEPEQLFEEEVETEDNKAEKSEEESITRKPFITENVPERNGKTRLITKIIGDSSYQLFFLLPDEEEHYVDIEFRDSSGVVDSLSIWAQDQFRYLIFPYSPEPKVLICIKIDGKTDYENVFKMPSHLRLKKQTENIKHGDEIKEETIINNEINEQKIETQEKADLNVEIDMSEISKEAIKLLKGE